MVKKFLNIFYKEYGSINQAAILIGFFTLLSQILGLVRDRSLAHVIGPSSDLDIYYSAFRIPDFMYVTVASLVSITVLVPFLIKKLDQEEDGKKQAKKFLSDVFSIFMLLIIVVSIVLYILLPYIAHYITPGFNSDEQIKMIQVSRIMLLSPIFMGISNLFGSVTQLFRKFLVYALCPVMYNLGIIIGVLVFYPMFGVNGLAIGVVIGAFLHLSIQIPVMIKDGMMPRLSFFVDFGQVKKVFALSLPRTLGLALNHIALIAIVAQASMIKEGSISIFNLSLALQSVPLGIIGASYSVAAFPTLAKLFSKQNYESFLEHIGTAARQIIFWSLPVAFLFIVLRAQIVRVILGSGSFSWADTRLTAAALALFVVSLVSQSMILLFTRGFYAAGKTTRPLVVNFVTAGFIIVFSYLLLWCFNTFPIFQYFIESLFRVNNIKGTAILMLPLAYSLGTMINFFLLWILFKKDFLKENSYSFMNKTLFQSFLASFFIGYTAYLLLEIGAKIFDLNTFFGVLAQGLLAGIGGVIVGIGVLLLIKNQEIKEIIKALKTKFWKTNVLVQSSEEGI